MSEWYCKVMGEELGPMSSAELKRMADQGQLTPQDFVRREPDDNWSSASRVKGLFGQQSGTAAKQVAPPAMHPPPGQRDGGVPFVNVTAQQPAVAAQSSHGIEQTVWTGRPSVLASHPFGMIICLLLAPCLIGLIPIVYWLLDSLSTKLTVTTKRTTLNRGILSKWTSEVRHSDVRNIQVSQSVLQRMLDCGTIAISSSGQAGMEICVSGIRSPQKVADMIRGMQA